jgi:hypothetical protein
LLFDAVEVTLYHDQQLFSFAMALEPAILNHGAHERWAEARYVTKLEDWQGDVVTDKTACH